MRKKILAANWKMNLLRDEAVQLINDFNKEVELSSKEIEVVVLENANLPDLNKKSKHI